MPSSDPPQVQATRGSAINVLQVVFASMWDIVVLRTGTTWLSLLGAIMVVVGVLAITVLETVLEQAQQVWSSVMPPAWAAMWRPAHNYTALRGEDEAVALSVVSVGEANGGGRGEANGAQPASKVGDGSNAMRPPHGANSPSRVRSPPVQRPSIADSKQHHSGRPASESAFEVQVSGVEHHEAGGALVHRAGGADGSHPWAAHTHQRKSDGWGRGADSF